MKKYLVIVESPAKAKTIGHYLGKDYKVEASLGHVRDLPQYKLGINIKEHFEPTYSALRDKTKIIKQLRELAEQYETVLIATDPDREGEAIAWHIQESLKVPVEKIKRIVFNEITKTAIQNAISESRDIDMNLVNAQQARRILDRLIGYKLSPMLGKKIKKGLSAGRVQSVALKMVCERENEINAFVPKEYWVISADLKEQKGKLAFTAKLFALGTEDQKLEVENQTQAEAIVSALEKSKYAIQDIRVSTLNRNPQPPFITSTLQQEASRRFNWSAKKTMMIAQQLYEGIDLDGESIGLITYMRTDSFRVSDDAKAAAKTYVTDQFGTHYLPESERTYKQKKNAQDAHEAIRPAYVDKSPKVLEALKSEHLKADHLRLYRLIWERFIASQMKAAKFENRVVIVNAANGDQIHLLKATGSVKLFDGYTKIYEESKDTDQPDEDTLPDIKPKTLVDLQKIDSEQKFTQPPPRFTEASLVKELEERGIGRPSTYAPTLTLIQDRGYVDKDKKSLIPSELGMLVNEQLSKYFSDVIDYNFTAEMENRFDEITEGRHIWQDVIGNFYNPFSELLAKAEQQMEKIDMTRPTDELCEKCGKPMLIKAGRFGDFMACSDYPACKNTKSLKAPLDVPCPECKNLLLEKKSRKGKVFFGCSNYPACKFASWDKPIAETCPACQYAIMVVKGSGKKTSKECMKCHGKAD